MHRKLITLWFGAMSMSYLSAVSFSQWLIGWTQDGLSVWGQGIELSPGETDVVNDLQSKAACKDCFCGSSWNDAARRCHAPCPGGVDSECEFLRFTHKCFAGIKHCEVLDENEDEEEPWGQEVEEEPPWDKLGGDENQQWAGGEYTQSTEEQEEVQEREDSEEEEAQ